MNPTIELCPLDSTNGQSISSGLRIGAGTRKTLTHAKTQSWSRNSKAVALIQRDFEIGKNFIFKMDTDNKIKDNFTQ